MSETILTIIGILITGFSAIYYAIDVERKKMNAVIEKELKAMETGFEKELKSLETGFERERKSLVTGIEKERENMEKRFREERTLVFRPSPFVFTIPLGASYALIPVNLGGSTAHDFMIDVEFPKGSSITILEEGLFSVMNGGLKENSVTLKKGKVESGPILQSIIIKAEKDGKEVAPKVSSWCMEETGRISLPLILPRTKPKE